MEVVDRIRQVPTGRSGTYGDVPLEDVMFETATQLTPEDARKRIATLEG